MTKGDPTKHTHRETPPQIEKHTSDIDSLPRPNGPTSKTTQYTAAHHTSHNTDTAFTYNTPGTHHGVSRTPNTTISIRIRFGSPTEIASQIHPAHGVSTPLNLAATSKRETASKRLTPVRLTPYSDPQKNY